MRQRALAGRLIDENTAGLGGHVLGTVSKALQLLEFIRDPDDHPGLSEIARKAGFDKATTRRLLVELAQNGFVEQDEDSRAYHLGPALRLYGRACEAQRPLVQILQPILRHLSDQAGETAHASEFGGGALHSICNQLTEKSVRVVVKLGQILPLHATASGLAYLAARSGAEVEAALKKPRASLTRHTLLDADALRQVVEQTRLRGYSICAQGFEDGVTSVAAAYLNQNGRPIGSIAIALPTFTATPEKIAECGALVCSAAVEAGKRLFGKPALRRAS